jgi:hypothetical protein
LYFTNYFGTTNQWNQTNLLRGIISDNKPIKNILFNFHTWIVTNKKSSNSAAQLSTWLLGKMWFFFHHPWLLVFCRKLMRHIPKVYISRKAPGLSLPSWKGKSHKLFSNTQLIVLWGICAGCDGHIRECGEFCKSNMGLQIRVNHPLVVQETCSKKAHKFELQMDNFVPGPP